MVMNYCFTTFGGAFVEAAAGGWEEEAELTVRPGDYLSISLTFYSISQNQALLSAPGH